MKGLPFDATHDDLDDFFRDFRYIEDSCIFGIGANGKKNGLGSILFENSRVAEKAAKVLDRKYIGDRYVNIQIASYGDYLRLNES